MRAIRSCPLQICPADKTARPVSLARLVTGAELAEVNGAVRLVERIRAVCATVIRQPRCYRDARAGKQQRAARTGPRIVIELAGWR